MYRFYPTLLNTFALYKHEVKGAAGNLLVDYNELIDRINRVPKPSTAAQTSGVNFENALITGKDESQFKPEILIKMRNSLPNKYKTQVFSKFNFGKIEIYGYVDLFGEGRAIDIKTTKKYTPGGFELNFQNLYMLGLKKQGLETMEYLITDFEEVYAEKYSIKNYNFSPLLEVAEEFAKFVELNKVNITDTKIFGQEKAAIALPLFPDL